MNEVKKVPNPRRQSKIKKRKAIIRDGVLGGRFLNHLRVRKNNSLIKPKTITKGEPYQKA